MLIFAALLIPDVEYQIYCTLNQRSEKGAPTSGTVKMSSTRILNDCGERFQTCYAYCKLLDFGDNPV